MMPAAIDFSTTELPFSVGDGIATATGFMGVFSDWTLLGVGIVIAAIIIGFIFMIVNKGKRAAGSGGK